MSSYKGRNINGYREDNPSIVRSSKNGMGTRYRAPRGQQPLLNSAGDEYRNVLLGCGFIRGVPVIISSSYCSNLVNNVGDESIYGRVWLYPILIDAGFITSETEHTIYIWNAHLDKSVTVSSIAETNVTGTTLNAVVPVTMPVGTELNWTLTVLVDGPVNQNAYYKPTIDSVLYSINVIGTRLLTISPEPNWQTPPNVKYGFQTVKVVNKYFREQRRPLTNDPKRLVTASFLMEAMEAQRVFNTLSYAHDKVLAIPIYNEKMYSDNLTEGLSRIVFTESHEYLWNFNNLCTHIILINHSTGDTDVEEIDNIDTTTSVVLDTPLPRDFDEGYVTIYPVMIASVRSLAYNEQTENVQELTAEFEEYWSG